VVIGAHCPIRGTDLHFQPWAVGWVHRWRNFFAHTNRHFCQPPSCGPVRLLLAVAGVLVLITVSIPYQPRLQQFTGDEVEYDPLLQDLAGRFASIGSEGTAGNLGLRFQIWRDSSQLILYRPWFEFDDQTMSLARPIIGYGPDLFRSTIRLKSRPVGPNLKIGTNHAHNYFIHNGVELGLVGLVASLGMFAAIFLAGGYQLFRESQSYCVAR